MKRSQTVSPAQVRRLSKQFKSVLREKELPIEVLSRLATTGGRNTVDQLIDLAYGAWIDEQPFFIAKVSYERPDSVVWLQRRFPQYVNPAFASQRFKRITWCGHVNDAPKSIRFELLRLPAGTSMKVGLKELERRILRPALLEEGIALAATHRKTLKEHSLVVPGSYTDVRQYAYLPHGRCVPLMYDEGKGPCLDLVNVDQERRDAYTFLGVRE